MTSDTELKPKRKELRSYVLRGGRMTAGQQRAFTGLWPQWGLDVGEFAEPLNYLEVFSREAPTVFEIGFGMGDSLATMAEAAPDLNFVGVEVHKPGVGRLLSLAESRDLNNLRVYCADALDVLKQCVADESLFRVQLYFPDPWHKKRHNKRRIVQPAFIDLVRQKLAPGGTFHLATDWEHYAEHMMAEMSDAEGWRNTAGDGQFSPKPDYRPNTKFEKRGERLGHGVWDLVFEKR